MPFSDVRGGVYIKGRKELMMTAFVLSFKAFLNASGSGMNVGGLGGTTVVTAPKFEI